MAKKKRKMPRWALGIIILAAAIIAVAVFKEGFERREPSFKHEQPIFEKNTYSTEWCSQSQMNMGGIVNLTIFGAIEKEIRGKKYETCYINMVYSQGKIESWMTKDSSFQFIKFYDAESLSFTQTSWKTGNVSCWQREYSNGTVENSDAGECIK